MAKREEWVREDLPVVETTEDVVGTESVLTTEDVVRTTGRAGRRRTQAGTPGAAPPEDEEVNAVGSYESWDQSGQGLDAAGAGMTGDSGSVGLTGTGFEDDTDLEPITRHAEGDEEELDGG